MVAVLFWTGGPVAAAEVIYVHQGEALFRFEAPEGWLVLDGFVDPPGETGPDAPRVISLQPPGSGEDLWVALWSPTGIARLEEAENYLNQTFGEWLTGRVALSAERTDAGGLAAVIYSGKGERQKQMQTYSVGLVQVAPGHLAALAFLGTPEAYVQHRAVLRAVLKSVRPVAAQ